MPDQPFDATRYAPVLDQLGVQYGQDPNGNLYADWEGLRLWFLARGEQNEIMAMRLQWDYWPPVDQFDALLSTLNDWNNRKFWPRASASVHEGRVIVAADLVVDLETGASDEMLVQQVRCIVGTGLEFTRFLAETYPQHREWLPQAG